MTVSKIRNATLTFSMLFSIGLLSAPAFGQTAGSASTAPVAVDVHAIDGAAMGSAAPLTRANATRASRGTSARGRASATRKTRASAHRSMPPQAQIPLGSGSNVVAEARRWIGTNPTGRSRLWCAHFMNFVLKRAGHSGTGSGLARSFASYGTRVSGPKVGAIAVMSRGRRGGHVGVVSGLSSKGDPIVISGNYGRKVAEATIPRGRVFAYVMPEG